MPNNTFPIIKKIIFVFIILISISCYSKTEIVKKYPIPKFKSNVSTTFTDICLDTKNGKLAVCSDGGYGEFPIVNGDVKFYPTGFIAATKNFIMRGYAMTDKGLSAIDNLGKFVFYGKEKLDLPKEISSEITGMACDSKNLYVSEKNSCLSILKINNHSLNLKNRIFLPLLKLESVTFFNSNIWVTDGGIIYRLDESYNIVEEYSLPESIKGFCFVKNTVFALSTNEKTILKIKLN